MELIDLLVLPKMTSGRLRFTVETERSHNATRPDIPNKSYVASATASHTSNQRPKVFLPSFSRFCSGSKHGRLQMVGEGYGKPEIIRPLQLETQKSTKSTVESHLDVSFAWLRKPPALARLTSHSPTLSISAWTMSKSSCTFFQRHDTGKHGEAHGMNSIPGEEHKQKERPVTGVPHLWFTAPVTEVF